MNQNPIDILDNALEQLREGVQRPSILAQYPSYSKELIPLLETTEALEIIKPVEFPSPERQRLDRNRYMAQVALAEVHPVSVSHLVRLQEWIHSWAHQNKIPLNKENKKMSLIIFRVGLVFSMLLAMAGGTAAMASNSLPESPFYPAKMLVEQINLSMQSDPAERAALHLNLAQERLREIVRLAERGDQPGESLMFRLEQHLNAALQFGAQLDDPGMAGTLEQARQMLQTQTRELTRVRVQAGGLLEEPLQQAVRLLERVRQQVEYGLQDPHGFRLRLQTGQAEPLPEPCANAGCEPGGNQFQYGPGADGPGPGSPGGNPVCPDCDPAGDQHRYGPQAEQPGPGAPGGNPECPSNDCEPAGDQHQYGPQPEQPGPGGPGGNPDCESNDCEPVGDQHQNGPQPNDPDPGQPGNPDPGGSGGTGGSEHGGGGSGGKP